MVEVTNTSSDNPTPKANDTLVSKIGIQKGVSYYNNRPGTISFDGTNLRIVDDKDGELLNVPITKVKKVEVQLGAMYIYLGFAGH